MTDKEYKVELKRIKKLIKKWPKNIGLGWWRIDFQYIRDDVNTEETSYSPKVMDGKWESIMVTTCDPYYLKAKIEIYFKFTSQLKDDELEHAFLHELMHIFMSPMHTKQKAKEEELVATQLAKAFIWAQDIKDEKDTSRVYPRKYTKRSPRKTTKKGKV